LQKKFSEVADRFAIRDLNERLSRNEAGVAIVRTEVGRLFDVFWKRLDQVKGRLDFQRSALNRPAGPMAIRVSGRYQVTLEIRYENQAPNDTTDDTLVFEIFDYAQDEKNSLNVQRFTSYFKVGPRVIWEATFADDPGFYTSEWVVDRALALFINELGSY
jgi:hypothetical protein